MWYDSLWKKEGRFIYLPGTVNERICDLRKDKGLSQKELSEIIGVAPSQLSRIESGETKNVSSDILIKLTKVFGVSADYILGLTTISVPKSYDISELGFSESTVKALVTGAVDVQMLNRLIGHKTFPYLIHLINTYFSNSITAGIMARNDIINMATATLGDFAKVNPENSAEVQADVRFLKSQKMGDNEAEIEKIKSTFIAILKDIKKDIEDATSPGASAISEFLHKMREHMKTTVQSQKKIHSEDVAAMVTNMVGQAAPLDEKSAELFEWLMKHILIASNQATNDTITTAPNTRGIDIKN